MEGNVAMLQCVVSLPGMQHVHPLPHLISIVLIPPADNSYTGTKIKQKAPTHASILVGTVAQVCTVTTLSRLTSIQTTHSSEPCVALVHASSIMPSVWPSEASYGFAFCKGTFVHCKVGLLYTCHEGKNFHVFYTRVPFNSGLHCTHLLRHPVGTRSPKQITFNLNNKPVTMPVPSKVYSSLSVVWVVHCPLQSYSFLQCKLSSQILKWAFILQHLRAVIRPLKCGPLTSLMFSSSVLV